jgi:hypothetical protein
MDSENHHHNHHESNGFSHDHDHNSENHEEIGGPNAHFDYLKGWYDYVNEFRVVKTARAGYDMAKHSSSIAENTLNKVESGIQTGLTNVAAPVYANYCYPATDRILQYYMKSLDTTKSAVDKTVNVASYTAALSIGLAVVATQMGVIVTTSAVNAFLTSLLYTKQAGSNALESAQNARTNVENLIRSALEQTQEIAKVPKEKANEHANNFLDIANTVFDRLLGLPEASEPVDSAIGDRILFLTNRVTGSLLHRFNKDAQVNGNVEHHENNGHHNHH